MGYDNKPGVGKIKTFFSFTSALLLFCSSALIFLCSCAAKKVSLPNYEGVDVREILAERNRIEGIEATFSVEFEKNDSSMSGEAALELTENSLDLRIYSLGFLVAEITEKDGVIKSTPEMSRNRKLILVDGLRSSILWWLIKEYEVAEGNGLYEIKNSWRKIIVDKKTMLPTHQVIELDNGRELKIFYNDPSGSDGFWYPAKMRIELSKYAVNLQIKTISSLHR